MKKTKTVEQWLKELPKSIRPKVTNEIYYKWTASYLSEAILLGIISIDTNDEFKYRFYIGLYETLKWAEK